MDKIQQLENRIKALEKWQADRTIQQIVYPLDYQSQVILNNYFLSKIQTLEVTSSSGQVSQSILVKQDNAAYLLDAATGIYSFTVNTATDVVTVGSDVTSGLQGSFANNDEIGLLTTNILPAPLATSTPVYVINSTGSTFQVSLTLGGAAINITTTGTGNQYLFYFN